jgi:MFS family permease
MIGLACALWSISTYLAGYVNSFYAFVLMRFILGLFSSALSPASYSLIADYFPLEYRSTAVSIENAGNYFGAAISSLSILFIDEYGWR